MSPALATRIGQLSDLGWRTDSHTEDSVAMDTRQPFNWLLFAVLLFFFFGIPALIYLIFWYVTSRVDVFIVAEGDELRESGDTWYIAIQEENLRRSIERQRQIKERGFWAVMWPSVLATILMIATSVLLIYLAFKLFD